MDRKNMTYSSRPSHAARAAHRQAKVQYPTYDTSLIRPQKKKKPKSLIVLIVILLLFAVIAVGFFSCVSCSKTLPQGQSAEVTIKEGASATEIADALSEAGVIENKLAFAFTVWQSGANSKLKSGVYLFEGGKSVQDYVNELCEGPDANSPKLVVAEGMKIKDIANSLEKVTKSRIKANDFIDACSDSSKYADKYSFLKEAKKKSLEGFLYPKTYSINSQITIDELITQMLDQYQEQTKDLDYSYPKKMGLSEYDTLILASIVEKESAEGLETTVASVFYNRIKKHMYLNSDATTAYEVGHDPTAEEVHRNSEYSTYTNYGLPPTPICSPGKASLDAVCNPKETNYLYFYFKTGDDGKLQYKFSENFEDHQEAIIE